MIHDEKVRPIRSGALGAPYSLVERGGRTMIRANGALTQYVAELSPFNPNARLYAGAMVDAANVSRELLATLRLLHATADQFQSRPSVKAWRDLGDARKTARDLLIRLGG